MGDSVAGKIRIDLLTNVARFKADMREAGREGLGGFQEEVARFNKRPTQKTLADNIGREKDAWKAAMTSARKEMEADFGKNRYDTLAFNSLSRMNRTHDLAQETSVRMKSYLPWGMTLRTELSREAALTAAAIGNNKQTIVKALVTASGEIANAGGLGGFAGGLGRFAAGHPVAVAGIAAAGYTLKTALDRDRLAREVGRESVMLGTGAEDWSRMKSAGVDQGMASRFQRSMAERSSAYESLNLDPSKLAAKPLKEALLDVADAFGKIKNPADRANLSMELFGRSGAEMLPVLSSLREKMSNTSSVDIISAEMVARTKAWDTALRGARDILSDLSLMAGRVAGSESGIGTHMMRGMEVGWKGLKGLFNSAMYESNPYGELDKALGRISREDYNTANANKTEQARVASAALKDNQKEAAKAAKEQAEAMERVRDAAVRARESVADNVFQQWRVAKYGKDRVEEDDYRKKAKESGMSSAEIDTNVRLMRRRKSEIAAVNEEENRNRERDSIRDRLRSPADKIADELDRIAELFGEESDIYKSAVEKSRDSERNRLGIRDPLGDYEKDLREHRDAVANGTITSDEFADWQKRRRKEVVGQMSGEEPSVRPIAAMAAGSREFHSLLAQSMTPDPQVKIAQDTLNRIQSIERAVQAMNEGIGNLVGIARE